MNFVMQILLNDTERSYDLSVTGSSDFSENFDCIFFFRPVYRLQDIFISHAQYRNILSCQVFHMTYSYATSYTGSGAFCLQDPG